MCSMEIVHLSFRTLCLLNGIWSLYFRAITWRASDYTQNRMVMIDDWIVCR